MKTTITLLSFFFHFFLSKNTTTQRNYILSNSFLKSFYLLIFTFIICSGTQAQIYNGDLTLSTQTEVDAFNYKEINGNLTISGTSIYELTQMSSLIKVTGNIYISFTTKLTSLTGLENITSVGRDIRIYDNTVLTSLTGLKNITSVIEEIDISNNTALTNLTGLNNITSVVGNISIKYNIALTSLTGLENMTSIGGYLTISNNTTLTNLTGLENIISVGYSLTISNNSALTSLTGLENMTSVGRDLAISNNSALTSLAGLENITSVGYSLTISNNSALSSLTELENMTSVGRDLTISNNSALTSLTGLENITSVGRDLTIFNNSALSSLTELDKITSMGRALIISSNPALTSLTGLENITSVGGIIDINNNDALTSLTELENIASVGSINIKNNSSLTSLTGLENITSVGGIIDINNNDALISLIGLENITYVGGLDISNNNTLTSLTGLQNMASVGGGGILISSNSSLTSLTGLENITSVGGRLIISRNPALTRLTGLDNITSVGRDLAISNNSALTTLTGLENITTVNENLTISYNPALTTLTGLENITSVGKRLLISSNSSLTSLIGLESMTSVGGDLTISTNGALTSLTGLENITSVGYSLIISYNTLLTSFCDLYELIFGGGLVGTYTVTYNLVNPTQQEISDGGPCILNVYIPDINFEQALIDLGIDSDGIINQQILKSDAAEVTKLNVSNPMANPNLPNVSGEINDMTGIEAFVNLTALYCGRNQITSLDLSNAVDLIYLNCEINQLSILDVTHNPKLERIYCYYNQLSSLDVSQNTSLVKLRCHNNQLTNLNVSFNTELTELSSGLNQLASLDVIKNTALVYLNCEGNQISSLDVSQNTDLAELWCGANQISNLNVTQNTGLTKLICYKNNLSILDATQNTQLITLSCSGNEITTLNLSQNVQLSGLSCGSNQLTSLDLRNGNNLNLSLDSELNNLTCINVDDETTDHSSWITDMGVVLSNDCSYNTQTGNSIMVPLIGDIGTTIEYESVVQSGNTTLQTSVVGPEIPEGFAFGNPVNYFDIETTATYTGAIEIAIYFGDMTYVQEGELSIMHYETDHWVDVTTSVDLVNKTIYGEVYSLSPFIVVEYVNTPPIIVNIIAPVDPIALGNIATVSVEFSDDNLREGIIDWGDGNGFVPGEISDQTVVWNYTYPIPGVYAVKVKLVDEADEEVEEVYQYIVVYDPNGGFVTGGGWINSPAGAYTIDPSSTGKANFGFVAKYKKGQTVPTGNTEFQFKAGDLNFNSSLFDWLIIAGSKAQFKGEGTINGMGSYGFMISAIDGNTKDKSDMFRIKIWYKANEEFIVYDNQFGAEDNSEPTTVIAGGSIVVHSSTKESTKSKLIAEKNSNALHVYPNPFTETTNIELSIFKSRQASIEVYDLFGRLVERIYEGQINSESDTLFQFNKDNKLSPGVYIVRVILDSGEIHTKNVIYLN